MSALCKLFYSFFSLSISLKNLAANPLIVKKTETGDRVELNINNIASTTMIIHSNTVFPKYLIVIAAEFFRIFNMVFSYLAQIANAYVKYISPANIIMIDAKRKYMGLFSILLKNSIFKYEK